MAKSVLVDLAHLRLFLGLETSQDQCSTSVLSNFPSCQCKMPEHALPTGNAQSLVVNPDLYLDIVWERYMQNILTALLIMHGDPMSGSILSC